MNEPFSGAPSPIVPLLALRNDGQDSVVPIGGRTELQTKSYRGGSLDTTIANLAASEPRPHAIIATGSAGSGKSAAVEAQRLLNPELFDDVIEDATHSDRPSQTQADALYRRLQPLSDEAERPSRPILIAANTGMLLQLFDAWRSSGDFRGLEAATLRPLGLSDVESPSDLRVVVLNLDDRPTAGRGGLLEELLAQLNPDDEQGVMGGSLRCGTCQVRNWCPVRTNASLASGPAAEALSTLAAASSRERGRHDSPRALWDWLSRIVAPPSAFDDYSDPCRAVARAAEENDYTWRLAHLLPVTVFSADGDLGQRISTFDPSLVATEAAYQIVSSAGIDPAEDARRLQVLADLDTRAEALAQAAFDRRQKVDIPVAAEEFRGILARACSGSALLADPSSWPIDRDDEGTAFSRALAAYSEWQSIDPDLPTDERRAIERRADEELQPLIQNLAEGLARLFGVFAEGRPFLPLRSYDVRDRSRIHVGVTVDLTTVSIKQDIQTEFNPAVARLLGHQPLVIRLGLGAEGEFNLDLPAFRLLAGARLHGLAAASQNNERFHALRRAAEALARLASEVPDAQLLAEEDGFSYLISQAPSLGTQPLLRTRIVHA